MNKTSINKAALLGSASALGYNWIYDPAKLMALRDKGRPMIFEAIDHDLYASVKNSYDVYPNHKPGDLDFMGEVYYLTQIFLGYDDDTSLQRYRTMLYEYFKEDSPYDGWVEGYVKDFLVQYKKELDSKKPVTVNTKYVDKQLIGLIYILTVYENNTVTDKEARALEFAKTMTSYDNIAPLTTFLHHVLLELDKGVSLKDAVWNNQTDIPTKYKPSILAAFGDMDIIEFVKTHAGIACGIEQSLPLTFYLLAHTSSWEEAMVLNCAIGGASSGRGIFVSALASRYLEIPTKYLSKLNYHVL